MPQDYFPPLPEGRLGDLPVTSGKFYNIEVYGTIYAEGGIFDDITVTSGTFTNVDVTGVLTASVGSDVDWSYISNVAIVNADITNGTIQSAKIADLAFDKITAATNTASLTIGSSGFLQSSGYAAPSGSTPGTGFRINGDGSAVFSDVDVYGTIYATAGEIGNLDVVNVLDLVGSGVLRSASSGARLQIEPESATGSLVYYSGDSDEVSPGGIYIQNTTDRTGLTLISPKIEDGSSNDAYGYLEMGAKPSGWGDEGYVVIGAIGESTRAATIYTVADTVDVNNNLVVDGNLTLGGDLYYGANDYMTWNDTDNRLGFFADGTRMWYMNGNGGTSQLIPYDNTGNFYDTHLSYTDSTTRWVLQVNGSELMRLDNVGSSGGKEVRMQGVYDRTDGTDSYVRVSTTGYLRRDSSSLRLKKNVKDASWLRFLQLRPSEFDWRETGKHGYGFIAEQVAEVLPEAAMRNEDGEVTDYDTRAVLAVLAAKVNYLEEQMKGCTCHVV